MPRIAKPAHRPLGVILYRGNSPFTGQPFVVIATLGESSNSKTGDMIQIYILLASAEKPTDSLKSGNDETVCGDCPLRGILGKMRTCYVNLGQGPRTIHDAYLRGRYVPYNPTDHDKYFLGRRVRFGAYGEPVLIPLRTVAHIASVSDGWTGYTHQYRRPEFQGYRAYFMASVHSPEEGRAANFLGWRYFRASNDGAPAEGEIVCPASDAGGWVRDCTTCKACKGAGARPVGATLPRNVVIATHGGFGAMHAARKSPALGALPILETA